MWGIYLPDHSNYTPTDRWWTFYVEKFVQSLFLFLLSESTQKEVENTIQENRYEYKHIAIVFSLVNCYDETISFHNKRYHQKWGHYSNHRLFFQFQRLEHEISHLLFHWTDRVMSRMSEIALKEIRRISTLANTKESTICRVLTEVSLIRVPRFNFISLYQILIFRCVYRSCWIIFDWRSLKIEALAYS